MASRSVSRNIFRLTKAVMLVWVRFTNSKQSLVEEQANKVHQDILNGYVIDLTFVVYFHLCHYFSNVLTVFTIYCVVYLMVVLTIYEVENILSLSYYAYENDSNTAWWTWFTIDISSVCYFWSWARLVKQSYDNRFCIYYWRTIAFYVPHSDKDSLHDTNNFCGWC